MLFNSYVFLLVFLPITIAAYYFAGRRFGPKAAQISLIIASSLFYAWWNPIYILLIYFSMLVNFAVLHLIYNSRGGQRSRIFLIAGIIFNVGSLAYFKYANFFVDNLNSAFEINFTFEKIILPLAISFFTFQKIAILVDQYVDRTPPPRATDFALFVLFFPQLIAGPIVHNKEIIPQFKLQETYRFNYPRFNQGLTIFVLGLAKKLLFADVFALWADPGFGDPHALGTLATWAVALSYTLQLYFDFSGYSDMAVGLALLFNVRLPFNFNQPYAAPTIQEFWRRWHMTLSRFLRDYVYIPLGGNRFGELRRGANLMATMLIGGLWHGAAWTFVVWGGLHGAGLATQRLWSRCGIGIPKWASWLMTFAFIVALWVLFRAATISDAWFMWSRMIWAPAAGWINPLWACAIGVGLAFAIFVREPAWLRDKPAALIQKPMFAGALGLVFAACILAVEILNSRSFLYFQF